MNATTNPDFADCKTDYEIVNKAIELWEIDQDNPYGIGDAVRECFNCLEAKFDDYGGIWIEGPQLGHWLSDDETASFVEFMAVRKWI